MFNAAIGAALVVGGCLLASAAFGDAPLLAARTAAQITGWLCLTALLLDVWAMARRRRGLRNVPRPTFAQAVAGITTLFTGALILYMSYFEWSDFRPLPMREAAAAEQLPRGMPDPSFTPPAAHIQKVAGGVVAIHNLRATPRRPTKLLVATVGATHTPDVACSPLEGLSRRWCEEQERPESCADRQDTDTVCPSPIPASLPY